MTTVVTGASGHLGGAVVRALLDEGCEVRAVDLHPGPTLEGLDVEYVRADVLDPGSLSEALRGAEVVYHLVALISITGDPDGRVRRVNVEGVRNVADAALRSGARRLVHCSSVHAFDLESPLEILTEKSPRPTAPGLPAYDRSKWEGEMALGSVIDAGLDAVIINPTGIIGPYDHAPSRMGRVFLTMFRGRLPALIGGGFDWVDSRDVARSLIAAGERGTRGQNYLVPGNHATITELAALAGLVSGTRPPRLRIPMPLVRAWGPIGDWLSRRTGSPLWFGSEALHALEHCPPISGEKAMRELGHRSRPLADTVADIHEWFASQGLLG